MRHEKKKKREQKSVEYLMPFRAKNLFFANLKSNDDFFFVRRSIGMNIIPLPDPVRAVSEIPGTCTD